MVPNQFTSFRNADFNKCYFELPTAVRKMTVEAYRKFCDDPYQSGLRFKKLKNSDDLYSVRLNRSYRAVGVVADAEIIWFWIGTKQAFEKIF